MATHPAGGEHDLHWGFNELDRPRQINGIKRRPFGAGIHSNVQAMAKLGQLYLQGGRWGEQQLIPESFVRLATSQAQGIGELPVKDGFVWTTGASRHYGLLWWNNSDGVMDGVPRDAYWSWGLHESFIIVVPSLNLVAVRAGDTGWAPRDDPKREDGHNNIVGPFLLPICQSVASQPVSESSAAARSEPDIHAPYPQSSHIPGATFSDLILEKNVSGPSYACSARTTRSACTYPAADSLCGTATRTRATTQPSIRKPESPSKRFTITRPILRTSFCP